MQALLAILTGAAVITAALCLLYMIGWFVAKYIGRVEGRIDGEVAFGVGFLTVFVGTVGSGLLYTIGCAVLGTIQ